MFWGPQKTRPGLWVTLAHSRELAACLFPSLSQVPTYLPLFRLSNACTHFICIAMPQDGSVIICMLQREWAQRCSVSCPVLHSWEAGPGQRVIWLRSRELLTVSLFHPFDRQRFWRGTSPTGPHRHQTDGCVFKNERLTKLLSYLYCFSQK